MTEAPPPTAPDLPPPPRHLERWPVLVVDDDDDVHEATDFALEGLQVFGRPLELWHARSAAEALARLDQGPEPAAMLVDVVMETDDAGLRFVTRVREGLGLHRPRIILRTGQPGRAPELDTVTRYDINDYKTKNELTRVKLCTTLTAALRSYDQLCRIDAGRAALERIIRSSEWLLGHESRDSLSEGLLAQIAGFIGVDPEGLVCARPDRPPSGGPAEFVVVAAAGRYSNLVQRRVAELPDRQVARALQTCLGQRRALVDAESVTLLFPGAERDDDFAAYVATREPLAHVDERLLELFRHHIGLCSRNVDLLQHLRAVAYRDQQVNLPNRRAFVEAIARVQADASAADGDWQIALVDIDDFSNTDDLLGHHFGDLLLQAVAQRLHDGLPARCHLARVADDKFGLLGPAADLQPTALRESLAAPFQLGEVAHVVSVCVGLAPVTPDGRAAVDLLKDAQIALKRAKSIGQGQDMQYSEAIGHELRERSRMVQEIRRAFDARRLSTVYQPQVDLASGRVVGVESLMRWWVDERTVVPPDRFIQVAEQSGLMLTLGTWSLRTSLATLVRLREAGHAGLRMSVNVSAVQFRQPDFVGIVAQALADFDLPAPLLELEITESAALVGMDQVCDILGRLRALGVSIALDDFGTGFSSLSYLHRLPIDRLKIDRSFVHALTTREPGARIARTVLHLGAQLGVPVLAEGVEDESQEAQLLALGCAEAQGYHYARPMSVQELEAWLTRAEAP